MAEARLLRAGSAARLPRDPAATWHVRGMTTPTRLLQTSPLSQAPVHFRLKWSNGPNGQMALVASPVPVARTSTDPSLTCNALLLLHPCVTAVTRPLRSTRRATRAPQRPRTQLRRRLDCRYVRGLRSSRARALLVAGDEHAHALPARAHEAVLHQVAQRRLHLLRRHVLHPHTQLTAATDATRRARMRKKTKG